MSSQHFSDDEIDRMIRAARPDDAHEGWASSDEGQSVLRGIYAAAREGRGARDVRIRLPRGARRPGYRLRPVVAGLGAVAAVTLLVGLAVVETDGPTGGGQRAAGPSGATDGTVPGGYGDTAPLGPRPSTMALAGYDTCTAALAGLRSHAAAHVTQYGLGSDPTVQFGTVYNGAAISAPSVPVPAAAPAAGQVSGGRVAQSSGSAADPAHSGTNDQESGVDEPDTIETDGRRIVTVSSGIVRITDVASRTVTGTFELGAYAGADSAQLLLSGNRLLVLLGDGDSGYPGGPIPLAGNAAPGYGYGPAQSSSTTFLLLDLSKAQPRLVSMFHPTGGLVDARLVDGTVRIVVTSTPRITLTTPPGARTATQRRAAYRSQVEKAPLSAWLPSWSVTTGGTAVRSSLPCTALSHPAQYSALSMLTVYSVDPAAGFADVAPVTIAADGGTVYSSTTSLYVASDTDPGATTDATQIHRFDIHSPGRPVYLGSGSVPGSIADSYSMSEWQGALRVITTSNPSRDYDENKLTHDLYVLDADTLTRRGHIGNIGTGEDLHAVRFLGDLGYVVTYQQLDPLFVLDLRDPDHPAISGRLTLTGYSGYLHDVGSGRLLGVGEATVPNPAEGGLARPVGTQVSLFDVATPSKPSLLSRIIRKGSIGYGDIDPHAFLYWVTDRIAAVPLPDAADAGSSVLLVRVDRDALTTLGTITAPTVTPASAQDGDTGITRTVVVGGSIWAFADSGLVATNLATLAREATVPFS